MLGIDTNLVVRYLTGDHPDQSPRSRALIDGQPVFAPVTVMLEAEWVLRSAYGYGASEIVAALRAFAGHPNVTVEDGPLLAAALALSEQGLDFADALHLGRSRHCTGFASFDRKLVRAAASAGCEGVRDV